MRTPRLRSLAPGLALALVAAAPAQAAFAPALDLRLDPATAGARPAVSAVVSQLPGETPMRRVALRLPGGFTPNVGWSGVACPPEGVAARACPAASAVGTVDVVSPVLGTASGPVHVVAGGGLVAFPQGGLAGLLDGTLAGAVTIRRSGLDLALDGLPAVPIAGIALRLAGGARGLVVSPATCGSGTALALLTSHGGELAVAARGIAIDGCTPVVSGARVTRRRFRPARSLADLERPGFGTVLVWSQRTAEGPTRVRVERRAGRRWRRAGSLLASAQPGRNVLRFDGRIRSRALRPGRYRFVLIARGSAAPAAVGFDVLPRSRGG